MMNIKEIFLIFLVIELVMKMKVILVIILVILIMANIKIIFLIFLEVILIIAEYKKNIYDILKIIELIIF